MRTVSALEELPERIEAARQPIADLPASPALSIVANGPHSLAGRKIGVLVTDGCDAQLLQGLQSSAREEGVAVELIAPCAGGATGSDGQRIPVDQRIEGAPSVLYDAVAILASPNGAT